MACHLQTIGRFFYGKPMPFLLRKLFKLSKEAKKKINKQYLNGVFFFSFRTNVGVKDDKTKEINEEKKEERKEKKIDKKLRNVKESLITLMNRVFSSYENLEKRFCACLKFEMTENNLRLQLSERKK